MLINQTRSHMQVKILSDTPLSMDPSRPDGWVHAYPQTIITTDGSIYGLYRRGTAKHGPDGSLLIQRSDDHGRTWSSPITVYDQAQENPPWTVVSAGLCADGKSLIASFNTVQMLDRSVYVFGPEAASFPRRLNVVRSDDGGQTWSTPVCPPMPDFATSAGIASSPFMAKPGQLCVPIEVTLANGTQGTAAIYSKDGGRTFGSPRLIAADAAGELSMGDARFTTLADGSHLMHLWAFRVDTEETVNVYQSRSVDGHDWSVAEPTTITGQISQPLALRNGLVLTICNHRQTPVGSQLWWSQDEGKSWNDRPIQMWDVAESRILGTPAKPRQSTQQENVWNTLPLFSFGTPNLLQTSEGDLLLTYWAALNDTPHIRACRFRLLEAEQKS